MKNWILTAAALFVFTTAATAAANAPDDDKRPDRTPMKGRMVENRTVKFDALPEAAQAFIRDFYAKTVSSAFASTLRRTSSPTRCGSTTAMKSCFRKTVHGPTSRVPTASR